MQAKIKIIFFVFFIIIDSSIVSSSEYPHGIILDKNFTNASTLELTGPNYEIKAEYGKLKQSNLFHSFTQFNLHFGESAVFSGPETVQNIITRVTGPEVSWIDGKLGTGIPDADLYFLNPKGIIFGNNASLDMTGSFFASTANYLTLGNLGKFNTNRLAVDDILTSDTPNAFGFIDQSMGSIIFEGGERNIQGINSLDNNIHGIHVSDGNSISIIAGSIDIKGTYFKQQQADDNGNLIFEQAVDQWGWPVYEIQTDDNGEPVYDQWGMPVYKLDNNQNPIPVLVLDENNNPIPVMETKFIPNLLAPGGHIHLVSIDTVSEISIGDWNIDEDLLKGSISLSEHAEINVCGEGGGNIIIRGGQFFLDHALLLSETTGDLNGGTIDIQTNDAYFGHGATVSTNTTGKGNGSDISIQATNTILAEKYFDYYPYITQIRAISENNSGNCGNIFFKAKTITFRDNAKIDGSSNDRGNGSQITLEADNILFDNAWIHADNNGSGNGSNISIIANEKIHFQAGLLQIGSFLRSGSEVTYPGKGGNVHIEAPDIHFSEKAHLDAFIWGEGGNYLLKGNNISFINGSYINVTSSNMGNATQIILSAQESVLFHGAYDNSSYISIESKEQANAASLLIDAKNISFLNDVYIQSINKGSGSGGNLTLKAQESVSFQSSVLDWGMTLDGNGVRINVFGETGIRVSTISNEDSSGDAGNLWIDATDIFFDDGAFIRANSVGAGNGGDVKLDAKQSILFNGEAMWEKPYPGSDNPWNTQINIANSCETDNCGMPGKLEMNANHIHFTNGALINSESLGKANGGDVYINARESVLFWGDDDDNSVSSIQASTKFSEVGAGDAGTIEINTHELIISHGACINSSSYGTGHGGQIRIIADTISLSDMDNNGNPSNIYSGSESISLLAGNSGSILINAKKLSLLSHTFISTASKGSGSAGNIQLDIDALYLDTNASITSGSESVNYYVLDSKDDMDSNMLISGDCIHISETGKMYVFTGKLSGGAAPFVQYFEVETPDKLPSGQCVSEGDMAHVFNDDTGSPADYICVIETEFQQPEWIRFDKTHITTFSNMSEIYQINNTFVLKEQLPLYANGVIKVLDSGDGKEAYYVCAARKYEYVFPPLFGLKTIRIGHFNVDDTNHLSKLSAQTALANGDLLSIKSNSSQYVLYNGEYIKLRNNIHAMDKKDEMFNLIQPQTGDLVIISDSGEQYIFSGNNWLVPGNDDLLVQNIQAMNTLSPKAGDIVYVVDVDGRGNPGNFLFSEDQWIPFAQGKGNNITINGKTITMKNNSNISTSTFGHGNAANISLFVYNIELDTGASIQSESTASQFGGTAGTININATGSITLFNNSSLSTKTLDAGGGQIFVNANRNIFLFNSEMTSSVKQGAGNGGDVTIHSNMVMMNHAGITANADEGDGGAIFIKTDNYIKSSDSRVTAASRRGNNGTIKIDAPDIDISSQIVSLPKNFLDATQWVKKSCAERNEKNISRFIIKTRDAAPSLLDDYQPSPPSGQSL